MRRHSTADGTEAQRRRVDLLVDLFNAILKGIVFGAVAHVLAYLFGRLPLKTVAELLGHVVGTLLMEAVMEFLR